MPTFRVLLVGFGLVGVTIVIHAVGSTMWMRFLTTRFATHDGEWRKSAVLGVLTSTGVVLLLLHFVQVIVWAVTYRLLPGITELDTMEKSIYFSLITFTTVGYGDISLGSSWRILTGIEGMNGVLLFGWSTALMYGVVQRSWKSMVHRRAPHKGGNAHDG